MTSRLAKPLLHSLVAVAVTLGAVCPVLLAQSMTAMAPVACHHEQRHGRVPQCCVGTHHQRTLPTAVYQLPESTAASISLDFNNPGMTQILRVPLTEIVVSDSPPAHDNPLRI